MDSVESACFEEMPSKYKNSDSSDNVSITLLDKVMITNFKNITEVN